MRSRAKACGGLPRRWRRACARIRPSYSRGVSQTWSASSPRRWRSEGASVSVVPAKAGTHEHRGGGLAWPCTIAMPGVMGPRLRGDDGCCLGERDMTARVLTVHGRKVAVIEDGAGAPLVYLHGFADVH